MPQIGESRTTYNVGSIEGGTSVNTIAQSAKMLCEYRSDTLECLSIMKAQFERIFRAAAERFINVLNLTPSDPEAYEKYLASKEESANLNK